MHPWRANASPASSSATATIIGPRPAIAAAGLLLLATPVLLPRVSG
jgi:hypothetical protein